MPEQPARAPAGAAHHQERFDSATLRRILQRAATEQHRMDHELTDSYSFEELEEMAAAVQISPEALRAAVEADRREQRKSTAGAGIRDAADARQSDWLARLERRLPGGWSPAVKQMVLAGAGVGALSGLLLSLSVLAPTAFWIASLSLIALCLLVLIGASPF